MSVQMPLLDKTGSKPSKVATSAEEIVGGKFDVKKFVENFDLLANGPGGVEGLRALTLHLAIRGRLVEHEKRADVEATDSKELVVPYEVPAGWAWRRVDQAGEVKLGRQRSPQNHHGPHMRPYLRVANVHEARIDTSDILEMNFDPEEAKRFLLKPNDLLLNEGQSYELVGRPAIYRGEVPGACFQNTLIRFRPTKAVVSAYALVVFRAYMRTGRFRSEAQQTTNIAHLSAGRLAGIEFPLPPLAEQTRIVAKVDELMRLIDDLEAKQAKKRETQTRLRTAALDALTSAEGPEEFEAAWKRVAENFAVLFERAESVADLRATVLAAGLRGWLTRSSGKGDAGLPDGWWRGALRELASFVTSGSRNWKDYYATTGAVFVRSQDIKTDSLDLSSPAFVTLPADAEGTRTRIERNDVLITITGANVGKVAHVDREVPEAYVSQHVALVRLWDVSHASWVQRWLVSPSNGRRQLLGASYGDKPGLNLNQVKSVVIDLPPPEERKTILQQIERKLKLCDNLEAKLRQAEETAAKFVEAVVSEMVA